MSTVIESIELRYKEGTSDKVYRASIETAEGGYTVNFAFGRRGAALSAGTKTATPVTRTEAESVYSKLVRSKTAKGYHVHAEDGRSITVVQAQGNDTGLRPQLPNAISRGEAEPYLRSDRWCAQEKYDGRRMLVRKPGLGSIIAANRKGLETACPESVRQALDRARGPFTADGELVGESFHAFDLLEDESGDLRQRPYSERLARLESVLGNIPGTAVEVVPTVFGSTAKHGYAESLRAAGREGVVFKDLDACWEEGKPAGGGPSLKLKFWETCSCVVLRENTGKRSIELGLGGRSVGSVTIPPRHFMPDPGQVVEVRYLYVTGPGGSLYQPLYLGVRTDIDADECTAETQNLKYKAVA